MRFGSSKVGDSKQFHYDVIKKQEWQVNLLYTDTDSLIYEIYCDDIYAWMKSNIELFDTSDYPLDNPYEIPRLNKKITLKMKDECHGSIIREFFALRAKLYAFQTEDKLVQMIAKGIQYNILQRNITYKDYYDSLEHGTVKTCQQNIIQSRDHHLYTLTNEKVAIDPYDDKRVQINKYETLPYGHKDTL